MIIPTYLVAPLYIAAFLMLCVQYWRVNPVRRVLNLHFALMLSAIVLMLFRIVMPSWLGDPGMASMVLFALAVVWLGVTLFLFRSMPPPSA